MIDTINITVQESITRLTITEVPTVDLVTLTVTETAPTDTYLRAEINTMYGDPEFDFMSEVDSLLIF